MINPNVRAPRPVARPVVNPNATRIVALPGGRYAVVKPQQQNPVVRPPIAVTLPASTPGQNFYVKPAVQMPLVSDDEEVTEEELQNVEAPEFVDPPEHLTGAIDGSMRMKRHLEADLEEYNEYIELLDQKSVGAPCPEPPRKTRRLVIMDQMSLSEWAHDDSDPSEPLQEGQEEKVSMIDQLLAKWQLSKNFGARFVLETLATANEVIEMKEDTRPYAFKPSLSVETKSIPEQIVNRLYDMRASTGPPVGPADSIKTFASKWDMGPDDEKILEECSFDELRYVMENCDGTKTVAELKEEASLVIEPVDDGDGPEAEMPGSQALARSLRLELSDPNADALVLGDANLSFCKLLARHRKRLGHTGRVVATTFEDFETLKTRYKEIKSTVKKLQDHGAEIWHGVDCTRLAVDPRFHGLEQSFGSVHYNFPHAGAVRGFFDAHPFVHWRHSNLMSLFFRAVSFFCRPGATVKVVSNSAAKGCRAEEIITAAEYSEFMHIGTFPFTEWILRGYHRSFGDKRDERQRPGAENYTAQNKAADMVYCFRYMPSGDELPSVPIKQPARACEFLNSVSSCACGFICQSAMKGSQYAQFHFKASGSHQERNEKEKQQDVLKLYQRFYSEASGVHIG
eukprot:gnl/MRDRNA2_/MRDRNA2_51183_c0_seq1.p1 gnl/MRDRNA2_/MRDRNA2_51183_c0~~gnl/MRDRNA2_/MRDRNA2_51183_c0_seq1.p1  ORF type:complete len:650 (-),score=134.63 gnl/MRDRNA2_/MRDRNA2_51183_c0_seq1:22-1896(-)